MFTRKEIKNKVRDYLLMKQLQLGRICLLPKIHLKTSNVPGRLAILNTRFFYKERVFSIQTQCCLTFSWIKLQILLRSSLIHIAIIILRHFLYLLYLCPCLNLQPFTKYLILTLAAIWNSALREKFNFNFKQFYASINKIFILGGRLGTRLKFYGDFRSSQYFLIS